MERDAPYHQILRDCGFSQEVPDWEAVAEWRGLSSCSVICCRAGEDYARVREFELLWRMYELESAQAREEVARFRELLRGKDRKGMGQYLEALAVKKDEIEESQKTISPDFNTFQK